MNTEQELKGINAHLNSLYLEMNAIKERIEYLLQQSDPNHYMPKVGEVVEVSSYGTEWFKRIFLEYKKYKGEIMCIVVSDDTLDSYKKGYGYGESRFVRCRRLDGEIIEFGGDKPKQPERNEAEKPNPYAVDWTNAPDWADVHAFDEDGKGYWYGANSNVYKKEWGYDYECSNFTLPDGLDWKQSKTFRPR